jgi:hypothetical protein
MWEGRQDVDDQDFWSGRVRVEVNGIQTYSLNAADHLLHVCVHGAKWNDTPSLRWVADALAIINSRKFKIDWLRLVRQAQDRRLSLPLGETLAYLEDSLGARIPPDVVKELRDATTPKLERAFYRLRSGPNEALKMIPVTWHWANSLRFNCYGNPAARLIQFLRYIQSLWKVKHLWHLPLYFMTKPAKRICQAVKGNSTARRPASQEVS